MATSAEQIAALRGQRPARLADLLSHPQFSRLLRAMAISSLGDWVGFVAVAALATRLGGDKAGYAVAGVMAARVLPAVVFGPVAGVLVDRFDRKRLMIVADISRGVMYAAMPLLTKLWAIYLLSFAIECFSLVWSPAKDASIPNMVPRRHLANANTVSLVTAYGTLPLGGIIYTFLAGLAATIGTRVSYFADNTEFLALWLDGGTFLFSALMVSGLTLRGQVRRHTEFRLADAGKDLTEGLRFMRQHALARAMLIGIVLAFTGAGSVMSIGPIFARQTLDAGSTGWGVLVTSLGLGMGVGMGGLSFMQRFAEKETIFSWAMVGAAFSAFVLAAMPTITLAALFTAVTGAAAGMTWVSGYTILQENIADEYRGRTFGTLTVLARFGLFVSLAGFPLLAQLVGNHSLSVFGLALDLSGTRVAIWAGGLVVLLAGIASRRGLARSRLGRVRPLSLHLRLRKRPPRGLFVAFEGVEGAGKGTQIRLVREWLEDAGRPVLVTREPGGTGLGERLRDAVLSNDHDLTVDARAEALVFAASRAQHVVSVIRPALTEGKIVLCDRYVDSSLAYQGVGRGLGEQDILQLNAWATQGLFPDLVVLLHVEPEIGLSRKPSEGDRFEQEDDSFHAKVANAYLHLAEEHPERYVVIDANAAPEVVHQRVRDAIQPLLRDYDEDEGTTEGSAR